MRAISAHLGLRRLEVLTSFSRPLPLAPSHAPPHAHVPSRAISHLGLHRLQVLTLTLTHTLTLTPTLTLTLHRLQVLTALFTYGALVTLPWRLANVHHLYCSTHSSEARRLAIYASSTIILYRTHMHMHMR